jgi:peptide/nickel transport system ATP-binding protein
LKLIAGAFDRRHAPVSSRAITVATTFSLLPEALLSAVPVPEPGAARQRIILMGDVPSPPINLPKGCRFHTRCPHAFDRCPTEEPALREIAACHLAACHLNNQQAQLM